MGIWVQTELCQCWEERFLPQPLCKAGLQYSFATNIWVFPWISLSRLPASLSLTALALLRRWKQLSFGVGKAVGETLMALVPFQCLLCRVLRADRLRRQQP